MSKNQMFCSHCGNNVIFKEIAKSTEELPETSNDYWTDYNTTRVLQCTICDKYTIKLMNEGYRGSVEDPEAGIFLGIEDWFQLYPNSHTVSSYIPTQLKEQIESIKLKSNRSPQNYIISMRKILEAILKEIGYSSGTLNQKIVKASREHYWPCEITRMAHYIRKIGNREAHEITSQITKEIYGLMDYCLDSILDFLYIAPEKLKKISEIVGDEKDNKERIVKTMEDLLVRNKHLLESNVNERSITHMLALYLKDYFPEYDIDCEYNKIGDSDSKKLLGIINEIGIDNINTDDLEGRTVYPDIIIHQRGTNNNYLVIEVKKNNMTESARKKDIEKLKAYKNSSLNYQYAYYVEIPVGVDRHSISIEDCVMEI